MKVLITGAAGNLGSLLATHLLEQTPMKLRLMVHRNPLPANLSQAPGVEVVCADLADKDTLPAAVADVDAIVHFAGVLFRANPETFLPESNTGYFKNLVDAAVERGVKKIILISFPHVEGPSSFVHPAAGRLDRQPVSVHARTRLEEERYLFAKVASPVSLRVGMVYGDGILMVDAAKWLAQRRLLGVWRERTQIHLISKDDFCEAAAQALQNSDAKGFYHIGDDGNNSLQEFLQIACEVWEVPPPWRMPLWMIYLAADVCEAFAKLFSTTSPLTRDFIDIGRVSYYGDVSRMKKDLLPVLKYPTLREGFETLLPSPPPKPLFSRLDKSG